MKRLWSVIAILVSAGLAFAIGRSVVPPRDPPPLPKNPTPLERLRAGYIEIDKTIVCTGEQTGMVRIRLSDLLEQLHSAKTVNRDIVYIEMGKVQREELVTTSVSPTPLSINQNYGLPTKLDFTTTIQEGSTIKKLVEPGKYVVVRVILDQAPGRNDSVEFLHPPNDRNDSGFAIMRAAGTNKAMFCGRKPIRYDSDTGVPRSYVDFGVKSTGQAETGSFGIGLLVRDRVAPFVAPIILDPHVKNEG